MIGFIVFVMLLMMVGFGVIAGLRWLRNERAR